MKIALFSVSAAMLLAIGCGQQDAGNEAQSARAKTESPGMARVAGAPSFADFAVAPKPEVTPALLERGKRLYAQNCAACHGVNGDGKGDAAAFLAPRPRDFVKANYRLRSTAPNNLPTDVDLFRQISLGMPGTPMPPWKHMLSDDDRWALVEHLKTFSPRFSDTSEVRVAISDFGTPPAKNETSIRDGKQLYTTLGCVACHGESGRGNGTSAPTLLDDSGGKIKPRDFANAASFKGGYSSKDIVRAILTGFNGTPMIGLHSAVKNEDVWKIAYYVESLGKAAATGPRNPGSQNFLSREELGTPEVKIRVTERAWKYDPEVIRVKKGQVVEITFEPTDNGLGVGHGLAISGYDEAVFINGAMVGVPKSAKFRADHAGTFTVYCSTQCSTEKLHPQMNGTFIVEDDRASTQKVAIH
jgi:mono/diheme cytochrome c family protein